jgi:hypothetical protein
MNRVERRREKDIVRALTHTSLALGRQTELLLAGGPPSRALPRRQPSGGSLPELQTSPLAFSRHQTNTPEHASGSSSIHCQSRRDCLRKDLQLLSAPSSRVPPLSTAWNPISDISVHARFRSEGKAQCDERSLCEADQYCVCRKNLEIAPKEGSPKVVFVAS